MPIDVRAVRERVPVEWPILADAIVGAVVTVVLSFVPLAPVLGGAIAGYLRRDRGYRVGALAGLLAAVPLVAVVAVLLFVYGFYVPTTPARGGLAALLGYLLALQVVGLVVATGTVVLGAAGGMLGVEYLDHRERQGRPEGRPAPASAAGSGDS